MYMYVFIYTTYIYNNIYIQYIYIPIWGRQNIELDEVIEIFMDHWRTRRH